MLLSTPTLATTNCKYTHQVGGNFTHKIESMTNYQRKVFPYIEDTRACVVSMNVKIEGTEYHTKGKFVFGPDQTETNACMHAEVRAKENIIKIVSPEILTGTTTMDCTPDETPVVVSQKDEVIDFTETEDFMKGWANPVPQKSNRVFNFGNMASSIGLLVTILK